MNLTINTLSTKAKNYNWIGVIRFGKTGVRIHLIQCHSHNILMNSTRRCVKEYNDMCRETWGLGGDLVTHARTVWNYRDEVRDIAAGAVRGKPSARKAPGKVRMGVRQYRSLRSTGIFEGRTNKSRINLDRVNYLLSLPCITNCIDPESELSPPNQGESPQITEEPQLSSISI